MSEKWKYEYSEANKAYEIAPIGKDGEPDWENEICITDNDDETLARRLASVPKLEQDNKGLRHDIARQIAISSELATENKEMLEMLKIVRKYLDCDYDDENETYNKIEDLLAKIESQKEGG